MGDFNLNLLNHQSHGSTGEFLDIMYSFMFYPLITKPSRITSSSATLIDNIFINHFANDIKSGLFFTDISDHLPVFTISYQQNLLPNPMEYFKCWDNSRKNKESFITQLKKENWSVLEEIDKPNGNPN